MLPEHCIILFRGIERRKIFRKDEDRANLLERLGSIATVIQRLLTGYAVSFNQKYRRHGQLFQNRYKSILCQEDIYLK